MPQTLLDGLTFPEGPRWHENRLWFSDFYNHRVVAVGLDGTSETMLTVPQIPSGLGWMADGSLLVVSMNDRRLLRVRDGVQSEHADLTEIAGGPCNDMVVDAKGRAYVGNFGYERFQNEAARPAKLARVDPDGRVTVVADDLLFPNGAVITPDGARLIIGETMGNRLTQFDIASDGALTNRRVFAAVDGLFPDGIMPWTPRARFGSPIRAAIAWCACGRWRRHCRNDPVARDATPMPACWAGRTGGLAVHRHRPGKWTGPCRQDRRQDRNRASHGSGRRVTLVSDATVASERRAARVVP